MTTQPVVLDHLYVLLYAVIYPLFAVFSYQRILHAFLDILQGRTVYRERNDAKQR